MILFSSGGYAQSGGSINLERIYTEVRVATHFKQQLAQKSDQAKKQADQKLLQLIGEVTEKVASKHHLDIVVVDSLYSRVDLTDEVIAELNTLPVNFLLDN